MRDAEIAPIHSRCVSDYVEIHLLVSGRGNVRPESRPYQVCAFQPGRKYVYLAQFVTSTDENWCLLAGKWSILADVVDVDVAYCKKANR